MLPPHFSFLKEKRFTYIIYFSPKTSIRACIVQYLKKGMACDTLTWFGQGSYLNEIEKRERVIGLLEYIITYK